MLKNVLFLGNHKKEDGSIVIRPAEGAEGLAD